VTALKPVRAEQVRLPEWKQNWTVPHCGSVLPICLRPVYALYILAVLQPESRHRRPKLPKHHPLIIWNIFVHFWHYISILFLIFLTEAAHYECSYRRTAHHATGSGISGLQSGLWTSLYGTQVVTILVNRGIESTTRRMQITGRAGQLHALYVELIDIVFEVVLMSASSRPTGLFQH